MREKGEDIRKVGLNSQNPFQSQAALVESQIKCLNGIYKRVHIFSHRRTHHEFLVGSVPLGLRLGERRPGRRQRAAAAAGVTATVPSGIETHDDERGPEAESQRGGDGGEDLKWEAAR